MLSNASFLAKFGFDTAENEPARNFQILLIFPILLTLAPNILLQGPRRGGCRALESVGGPGQTRRPARRDAGTVETRKAPYGGDVRERRLAKFRQNVARFRLYRHRFLQENTRFAAFFKIYQII